MTSSELKRDRIVAGCLLIGALLVAALIVFINA
jgi:hypothetical protein